MTNAQRVRAVAIGKSLKIGHVPLRWLWPDSKGRWDTRLPVIKCLSNAHMCNFTQLPGSANGRNKRRARALAGSSYREAQTH